MNNNLLFKPRRTSKLDMNEVYFWTDTIKDWKHLLKQDKYKEIIIRMMKDLVVKEQIAIYGFVIMPNHLHFLWEMLKKTGKEMPYASFNKATAHNIVNDLRERHPLVLDRFKVGDSDREYRVWQRDPLGVLMYDKDIVEQKLNYIHDNPMQEKWSPPRGLWHTDHSSLRSPLPLKFNNLTNNIFFLILRTF